jgi:hypothetical protein
VAEEVYREHGFPCIITSLLDGTHNTGSLHPKGNAADLRVKHIPDAAIRTSIYEELKATIEWRWVRCGVGRRSRCYACDHRRPYSR